MSTEGRRIGPTGSTMNGRVALAVLVWAWVVVPFLYGVYQLLSKIPALFGS